MTRFKTGLGLSQ